MLGNLLKIEYFVNLKSTRAILGDNKVQIFCKSLNPPLVDIVHFCSLRIALSLIIHSPWWPVSSLAHNSLSGSNIICNNPSPPLTDIVRFGPLRITISLTVLKRVERFSHPCKVCFIPLSNQGGTSQSILRSHIGWRGELPYKGVETSL